MSISASKLSVEIFAFLDEFADIKADFDPEFDDEEEKFASPDAGCFFAAANILQTTNKLPKTFYVASTWGSGGYSPYSSQSGKATHDQLMNKCKNLTES